MTGRPKKLDYEAIRAHKDSGLNVREVAEKFKCSRGAVQYIYGLPFAVNRPKKVNRYVSTATT